MDRGTQQQGIWYAGPRRRLEDPRKMWGRRLNLVEQLVGGNIDRSKRDLVSSRVTSCQLVENPRKSDARRGNTQDEAGYKFLTFFKFLFPEPGQAR